MTQCLENPTNARIVVLLTGHDLESRQGALFAATGTSGPDSRAYSGSIATVITVAGEVSPAESNEIGLRKAQKRAAARSAGRVTPNTDMMQVKVPPFMDGPRIRDLAEEEGVPEDVIRERLLQEWLK